MPINDNIYQQKSITETQNKIIIKKNNNKKTTTKKNKTDENNKKNNKKQQQKKIIIKFIIMHHSHYMPQLQIHFHHNVYYYVNIHCQILLLVFLDASLVLHHNFLPNDQ